MDVTDAPLVASLDEYFTKEALMEMPEIDKRRNGNILRNYQEMKKLGLDPVPPDFICKPAALVERNGNIQVRGSKRRRKPVSYKDEDDDWSPSMEVEGRRYNPWRKSRTSNKHTYYNSTSSDREEAGTSVQVSSQFSPMLKCPKNNQICSFRNKSNKLSSLSGGMVPGAIQENATLSVGQKESVHLWRTAKLEPVPRRCVKVVPLPPTTSLLDAGKSQEVLPPVVSGKENTRPGTRKNPRRKTSLVLNYKEMDVCEDDFIYCDKCSEEREGMCPIHPLYLILDAVVVRDGSVKDRAKKTVPWPLSICNSKIKGAGLGVWTNESLPANLIFGPYEGHFFSNVEPGKESGYGWLLRWMGCTNACVDAFDESVSNWMRYVNCSRNEKETNVGAFQYKGQIYYKTLKEINRGTELMVWYGDEYGKELGLTRDESFWKVEPTECKGKEHDWCGDFYSSYPNLHYMKCCVSKYTYKCFNGEENITFENSRILQTKWQDLDKKVEVGIFQSPLAGNSLSENKENFGQLQSENLSSLVFTSNGKQDKLSDILHSKVKDTNGFGEIFTEHENLEEGNCSKASNWLREKSLGPKDKKPFEFRDCVQRFSQDNILKIHTAEKPFESEDWGQRFTEGDHLKNHVRIHASEKPVESKACGQRFSDGGNLKRHMRILTGEKPFECKDCGRRFSQGCNWKSHMRIHTGEKPFECKDCGQRFSQGGSLKSHMRIHKGEKPFECKDCGRRFTQRGHLKEHMKIHTGEKPFECKDCGQRFSNGSNLKSHMRIHTGEKPFECKDCGRRFTQRGHLKKHMRIHTSEKLFGKDFLKVVI